MLTDIEQFLEPQWVLIFCQQLISRFLRIIIVLAQCCWRKEFLKLRLMNKNPNRITSKNTFNVPSPRLFVPIRKNENLRSLIFKMEPDIANHQICIIDRNAGSGFERSD